MANDEHVALLKQGVNDWNTWRQENESIEIDLRGAHLSGAFLNEANLTGAHLSEAFLNEANLTGAHLRGADLSGADLTGAYLRGADLSEADLSGADLRGANLREAHLTGAHLTGAHLDQADLRGAHLSGAHLTGAILTGAQLVETNMTNANLTGCHIYGISAWNLKLEGAKQKDLIITREGEPVITVDNLEVAQFIYLLLRNEKIRDVIDTIAKKGVLILGRFTERKDILEKLRDALRQRGYLPIVFDFERPTDRDFTETVMTLAGMCLFIIADITKPQSVPYELAMAVPNYMIPFVPIIQKGEKPFAMFVDLWKKYRDWVFAPLAYDSIEKLVEVFDTAVIERANHRREELRVRKAEELITEDVEDYRKA